MRKRVTRTRRKVVVIMAAGALMAGLLVFGPVLEAYRQYTYPLVPGWSNLQVVYLAALGAAPLAAGLNAQTLTDPQAVMDHAQTHGLE